MISLRLDVLSLFILLSLSLVVSFFTSAPPARSPAPSPSLQWAVFYFLSLDPYDPCVQRDHVFKVLRSNKQRTGAIRLLLSLSPFFLSLSFFPLFFSRSLFAPFTLVLFPRTLDSHRFFMIPFSPSLFFLLLAHLPPARVSALTSLSLFATLPHPLVSLSPWLARWLINH